MLKTESCILFIFCSPIDIHLSVDINMPKTNRTKRELKHQAMRRARDAE